MSHVNCLSDDQKRRSHEEEKNALLTEVSKKAMSLVPLSGMAAEPAVFPDPAVEMQGDRAVIKAAAKKSPAR